MNNQKSILFKFYNETVMHKVGTKIHVYFSEIWREYMGIEGLDLTPELIIAKNNDSLVRGKLLIDKNMTTCVALNGSSDSGEFYFLSFAGSFRFK